MWFPSLSKKWSFQWQHFQVGRKRIQSVSNGFNIDKVVFRFQAPLSTEGSLPRLETLCLPLTRGNGNVVSSWVTKVLLIKQNIK